MYVTSEEGLFSVDKKKFGADKRIAQTNNS